MLGTRGALPLISVGDPRLANTRSTLLDRFQIISGYKKRLGVAIRAYDPIAIGVQCVDAPVPAPAPLSCRLALDLMPASTNTLKFGDRGTPSVDVGLPRAFSDCQESPLLSQLFPAAYSRLTSTTFQLPEVVSST